MIIAQSKLQKFSTILFPSVCNTKFVITKKISKSLRSCVCLRDVLCFIIWNGPCVHSNWSNTHALSEYKTKKKRLLFFSARLKSVS